MSSSFFENLPNYKLLDIFKKNGKLIFGTVFICTSLMVLVALIAKPRYLAKASFFVPSNNSLESTIENPQFGFDLEADRLLQLMYSKQLQDSVVQKFDLVNYFEIDTNRITWREELDQIYNTRIKVGRTNIMAIYVNAETMDPEFSAKIVDYVLEITQRLRDKFFKTNSMLGVEALKGDYLKKKLEVDSLEIKLVKLRSDLKNNPNVYITNNQIITSGATANLVNTQDQLDLEIYTQRYIYDNNRLQGLREKYESALNIYNRPIPKIYIIDNAIPVYKKVYPSILNNFIIGFFGSLIFMTTLMYLKEFYSSTVKSK